MCENYACFPHPTVLVFIEKLGRDCRGIPRFASHFITNLPTHRDVNQLVLDAFTVKDSYHFCLLRLYLENNGACKNCTQSQQRHWIISASFSTYCLSMNR